MITSRSSNELFIKEEFDTVLDIADSCMALETSAQRQTFLTLMKKFVFRMREGLDSSKRHNVDENHSLMYQTFIVQIGRLYMNHLNEDANAARRSTILQTMILFKNNLKDFLGFLRSDKRYGKILFCCLEDSYDDNRQSALALLKMFPEETLGLDQDHVLQSLWKDCLRKCRDVNPAQANSSGFLLLYLLQASKFKGILGTDVANVKISTIHFFLAFLGDQIELARSDLQLAANTAPLYGVLFCIRTVIESSDRSTFTVDDNPWIQDLVEKCLAISELINVVLCSDTPEGLTFTGESDSQKLLLCAWRSSKEVSLLLGAVINLLPKGGSLPDDMLPRVQTITDFFVKLLELTKHRGAFEQAYIGFCTVCSYLWSSGDPRLLARIEDLLKNTLSAIWDNSANLCVTRRSAGLPFLIQAVVSTGK